MAVNIKNHRVEHLLDEITGITGEGKTEAIRRALEERHERLTLARQLTSAQRLMRVLEREIWPSIPDDISRDRLTKAQEEAILGFGPAGV